MTDQRLFGMLWDLSGPEAVTASVSDEELAHLLDALYQNLDTPTPDPRAILWYEIGVEESYRRARRLAEQRHKKYSRVRGQR